MSLDIFTIKKLNIDKHFSCILYDINTFYRILTLHLKFADLFGVNNVCLDMIPSLSLISSLTRNSLVPAEKTNA